MCRDAVFQRQNASKKVAGDHSDVRETAGDSGDHKWENVGTNKGNIYA